LLPIVVSEMCVMVHVPAKATSAAIASVATKNFLKGRTSLLPRAGVTGLCHPGRSRVDRYNVS
jgi:hypothetical protein